MSEDSLGKDPRKEYEPAIGQHSDPRANRASSGPVTTYADFPRFLRALNSLDNEIRELEETLDDELSGFVMPIDFNDTKLVNSVAAEWPERLGQPKDYVSYQFYKALKFRNTTSSKYIRDKFEEASRDLRGTSALDFKILLQIMKNESLLMRSFANEYLETITDVGEFRVLEQFQDWVISAVGYTRKFSSFYAKGKTNPEFVLPAALSSTTSKAAKHGQAAFKVRLNADNDYIEKDIQSVERNFNEYASSFYAQNLGPALNFRLHVSSQTFSVGGKINRLADEASRVEDDRLGAALSDQMRRRFFFEEKMSRVFENIKDRDKSRSYIQQLAAIGRDLPASGPRLLTRSVAIPQDEQEVFFEVEQSGISAVQSDFSPNHGDLVGRDDPDAHIQYLNKLSGDTIFADVDLAPGVRIDGVIPRSHKHDGLDGSAKINAKDLEDGSLDDSAVDLEAKPPPPYGVTILGYEERVVPPGVPLVDATIQWQGFDKYSYEVNFVRLGDIPNVVE